ncbi:hypothetical protein [Methylobacterium aerolatum]|uniref:Uncharacterized protein n=1 Tax=Methylobacterium aerolatum TaxID=418708 RepID=A0ABU0I193_9HYPH|nr:hypothetical protein [Methylobacterium aerolatum]MDQ0448372.1 hypothetical protein [Methylobacterium aerolatum]
MAGSGGLLPVRFRITTDGSGHHLDIRLGILEKAGLTKAKPAYRYRTNCTAQMRLSAINLRGDLCELSTIELESKFDNLLAERQELADRISNLNTLGLKSKYLKGLAVPFGRGPVRAAIFYKLRAVLYLQSSPSKGLGRLYMLDCELQDIMDECARRLAEQPRRKGEVR